MYKKINSYVSRLHYKTRVYAKFGSYKFLSKKKTRIVDDFHKLFYDSHIVGKTWNDSYFLGVGIQKCPFDLFIYQEILFDVKPDVIIETGTEFGGSAYYLAVLCDVLKKGRIVTVDIKQFRNKPKHPRITYLLSSSTDAKVIKRIEKEIKPKDKVLVILDSDHTRDHVLRELEIYSKFVTKGSYLICEDTNVNGHPVNPHHGLGPMEAIEIFMKDNENFKIDKSREKFYLTFNPNGYLKRVK